MHNITDLRPKPEDIDYFGGCPACWRNDGYLNVGREHWFICLKHRVKWLAGENFFSTWRSEAEAEWQVNAARIGVYRVVDPICPPRHEP
jgi:hypothetical protein